MQLCITFEQERSSEWEKLQLNMKKIPFIMKKLFENQLKIIIKLSKNCCVLKTKSQKNN